jgi:hypothetical protein
MVFSLKCIKGNLYKSYLIILSSIKRTTLILDRLRVKMYFLIGPFGTVFIFPLFGVCTVEQPEEGINFQSALEFIRVYKKCEKTQE